MSNTDEKYMRLAIELAEKGRGRTSPNPVVGSVVVKDGRIIGQGYHERCGEYHAERNALLSCTEDPAGATIYATLEPCKHYGRTPPCTEIILESGIKRVVIGAMDSNAKAGGGAELLRSRGLEVETGVLEEECREQNKIFFHYIASSTPYVVMKYAMTLDGKIAAHTGDSRWVTGEAARRHVHALRDKLSAIMVGIGTVLADDPLLTCRIPGGRNPVRVVADSSLRIPLSSQIVKTAKDVPTIITTVSTNSEKIRALEDAGCIIEFCKAENGRVDIADAMRVLGARKIDSVLLEGGGKLNFSAVKAGAVNSVMAYIAPKIIGGAGASPVGGEGFALMREAIPLKNTRLIQLGDDILLEGEVK